MSNRLSHIIAIIALAFLPLSCKAQSTYTIDVTRPLDDVVSEMVAFLTPKQMAQSLTELMLNIPIEQRQYVSQFSSSLQQSYTPSELDALSQSLDSIWRVMPPHAKARLIVMSSTPVQVAYAIKRDSMAAPLAPIIQELYAPYPPMLEAFRSALR